MPGELGIADKGFVGAERLLVPFKGRELTNDQREWNTKLASVRILAERTNGVIKKFLAFGRRWRGDYDYHRQAFVFICPMVNIHIDLHPLQPNLIALLRSRDAQEA